MNSPYDSDNRSIEEIMADKQSKGLIFNRQGLSRINYRIGTYSAFRDLFFDLLDKERLTKGMEGKVSPLSRWTYRLPDDPAIALIESTSIICDILTFYQNLYANEAYLRTSQWRESISRLVALTGYYLSPGFSGQGWFAFEVKGDSSLAIPEGFPIKATLSEIDETVEFETSNTITAYPELNEIKLFYNIESEQFNLGMREFHIKDGKKLDLQPRDRLFLSYNKVEMNTANESAEIVIVEDVWSVFDYEFFSIRGSLQVDISSITNISARKLGRTFRHFGYNAPSTAYPVSTLVQGAPGTYVSTVKTITYARKLEEITKDDQEWPRTSLNKNEFPLDVTVKDLVPGRTMVFQIHDDIKSSKPKAFIIPLIQAIRKSNYTWGSISGNCSSLFLAPIFENPNKEIPNSLAYGSKEVDIDRIEMHEIISECVDLGPGLSINSKPERFLYFGSDEDFKKIKDRDILISHSEGVRKKAKLLLIDELPAQFPFTLKCRLVCLDPQLEEYLEFPANCKEGKYDTPISYNGEEYIIYGNTGFATQGKTDESIPIGSGDSRETFQEMPLPKSPLSYLFSADGRPELSIRVNGQLWDYVPSLFNKEDTDEVYTVRSDEEGTSWIKFGDGINGSKLPSGIDNISATYRTGIGAYGELKPGTKANAADTLFNLGKIFLVTSIYGGIEPELGDSARISAPGKVQALDRLVSLKDYETATQTIPGVLKAKSSFSLSSNLIPTINLTILTNANTMEEKESIQSLVIEYDRLHGSQRYPLDVIIGSFRYVAIAGSYGVDSKYLAENVEQDILEALGVYYPSTDEYSSQNGLFSLQRRSFNQSEYLSRIEATIQNVKGVTWVDISLLSSIVTDGDPALILIDEFPSAREYVISSSDSEVLRLCSQNLSLTPIVGKGEGE